MAQQMTVSYAIFMIIMIYLGVGRLDSRKFIGGHYRQKVAFLFQPISLQFFAVTGSLNCTNAS